MVSQFLIKCGERPSTRNPAVDTDTTTEYQDHLTPDPTKEIDLLLADLETLEENFDNRIEELDSRIKENGQNGNDTLISLRKELEDDRSEIQYAITSLGNPSVNTSDSLLPDIKDLYERLSLKLDTLDNNHSDR